MFRRMLRVAVGIVVGLLIHDTIVSGIGSTG